MSINAEHIENLARQIDATTDCEVLMRIVNTHINALRDLIQSLIDTQSEILSNVMPLKKVPTGLRAVIRWIRKFISGMIMPQLRAYIKIAQQIIALSRALATLANSVTNARLKLEQCALETVPAVINQEINASIRDLQSPLTSSLNQIEIIQDQIEGVIGNPLSQRINTSSPEAFTASAETALKSIESQVGAFVDVIDEDEDDDPVPLTANVMIQTGETLIVEDGLITGVLPPEG